MGSTVSPELLSSPAFQFIQSQGWDWKHGTHPNVELETCPYCNKTGYGHCYIEVRGAGDEQKQRDGLHQCHKCGKSGSLYSLKQHLGLTISGVDSTKEWAGGQKKVEPLPDIEEIHQALLQDEEALDYLMNGRGFSKEIIKKAKLGIVPKRFFKGVGEVRALVYPYLVNDNAVFVHYRTLPTMPLSENKVPKAFSSPTGWDVPLYNGEVLREGLVDIVMVEGEPNCIAAMDHGIDNICGVPGANIKKAQWIDTLDKLGLDKIYICYDMDHVGQKAAQELAARIGVERCWRITLPEFMVTTEEGETRKGKDLNEWFVYGGGTKEGFDQLKAAAAQYDVNGVASTKDAVQEFYDELLGKGSIEPKYKSPWPSLNRLVGFDDGDVIDILAPEKVGKTTLGLNLLEHVVHEFGVDGVIICLEMTRAKLARKWIAHKAQIADNLPKSPEEAVALRDAFLTAIPEVQKIAGNRPGTLYFCLPTYKTDDDLYTLMRDCIRRYGAKWIMIDNIQRWADTATRGKRNRTEHLSEISKVTSQIAKEHNTVIVRILQPHRIADGKMVTTDNTDGSSQIAKDCDCTVTAHRNKIGEMSKDDFEASGGFVQQEEMFDDKMLLTVGLSRYSGGGRTTVHYNGATSTISEYDAGFIAKVQADASKGVGYSAATAFMNVKPGPPGTVGDDGGVSI